MKNLYTLIIFNFYFISFVIFATSSQALTEHFEKKEQFKKLDIKKFYIECSVETTQENGKIKERWFSNFRDKFYFDFNVETMRLEAMSVGLTRDGIKSNRDKFNSKNHPFFFTKDEKDKYLEMLMVIPDIKQVHKLKVGYLDDFKNVINTSAFSYSIYQLGEDAFNNFVKFHYSTGKINEFETWVKNYPIAINLYFKDKPNLINYQLTKIEFISWGVGNCNNKNLKN
jgi:hypothetical protein